MGNVASQVLGQCSGDCAKYVLNSCHSKCGISDYCTCDIQTDKVELLEDSASETDIEAGCLKMHHK